METHERRGSPPKRIGRRETDGSCPPLSLGRSRTDSVEIRGPLDARGHKQCQLCGIETAPRFMTSDNRGSLTTTAQWGVLG
jgi:hypothetical protein